jgi:hypothetical protein
MEDLSQEKVTGRLCAFGKAKYTNLVGGGGYQFVKDGGFAWELDPLDIERYGITMDAITDCVEQLEKMGSFEEVKAAEHLRDGEGWKNIGLKIQSTKDPRITCMVTPISNEHDDYDCKMRWFVDLDKESPSAKGPAERNVDAEELKAVERAREMSKNKNESIDKLFDLPKLFEAKKIAIKPMAQSYDRWGIPLMEEKEVVVGVDTLEKPHSTIPSRPYGEKELADKEVKPKEPGKDPEHMEGSGTPDPLAEFDVPAKKVKPGEITSAAAPKEMGESASDLRETALDSLSDGDRVQLKVDREYFHDETGEKELIKKGEKGTAVNADRWGAFVKLDGRKPVYRFLAFELKKISSGVSESSTGRFPHKHPSERAGKKTEALKSDNDGHIYQANEGVEKLLRSKKTDEGGMSINIMVDGHQVHAEITPGRHVWMLISGDEKLPVFGGAAEEETIAPHEALKNFDSFAKFISEKAKPIIDRLIKSDYRRWFKDDKSHADEAMHRDEKVTIHPGHEGDKSAIGIHLTQPSKKEIEDAKEDALNKGFKRIYIHKEKPKFGGKEESRHYFNRGGRLLQVEDANVYVGKDALEKPAGKEGDKDRGETAGKVDVKPGDITSNATPKEMAGKGTQVGGTDKETELPGNKVKPGDITSNASPKLMAERKKIRENALKRQEERKKAKGAQISESYHEHPHKVMETVKHHCDEAHRAIRKGHEMVEWAEKKLHEYHDRLPSPVAAEMVHHHSKIQDAKNKVHESKRAMSEICEDIDRIHRHMKKQ